MQVAPKGAPHEIVLVPSGRTAGYLERILVGTIEVRRAGRPIQKIPVHSVRGLSVVALDMNFDGYLDLRALDDFGGKWQQYRYWVFDPGSGRFVKNALARDLDRLTSAQMDVDPQVRRLHLKSFHGQCFPVRRDYVVRSGRLRLIEEWRLDPDRPDCPETHRRYAVELAAPAAPRQ